MKQKCKVVVLTAKEEAKKSYSREEVEALCRESFAHGWTSWDSNEDYAVTIEKFIKNNLK